LRGDPDAEFEPELESEEFDNGRVDDETDGLSRGRIGGEEANGRQEMEIPRTAGISGTPSSTASPSHGTTTNTASFSPSVFPSVPDMMP
jgi:hypothetical protein